MVTKSSELKKPRVGLFVCRCLFKITKQVRGESRFGFGIATMHGGEFGGAVYAAQALDGASAAWVFFDPRGKVVDVVVDYGPTLAGGCLGGDIGHGVGFWTSFNWFFNRLFYGFLFGWFSWASGEFAVRAGAANK